MLALAIEFSRCSGARTPRAEQCARPARAPSRSAFHFPEGTYLRSLERARLLSSQCTDLESPGAPTATADVRGAKWLLRKEVIQPHLPVRLPCYDFTPIASPTFDGSLPKGLGHRLRVLPTFVV